MLGDALDTKTMLQYVIWKVEGLSVDTGDAIKGRSK
jgi:hypothetical protein